MVHGENRIPYWIDRSLPGLAGPDYDATISFGLPFELGDCPYGKSRLNPPPHEECYSNRIQRHWLSRTEALSMLSCIKWTRPEGPTA